jgi:hypothetical protein
MSCDIAEPKSEWLIDVNDVALGHITKQRRNEPGQWIWSKEQVHEPLIDTDTFEQVQALHRAKDSADERSPRRTPRGYALRLDGDARPAASEGLAASARTRHTPIRVALLSSLGYEPYDTPRACIRSAHRGSRK